MRSVVLHSFATMAILITGGSMLRASLIALAAGLLPRYLSGLPGYRQKRDPGSLKTLRIIPGGDPSPPSFVSCSS